MTFFAQHKKALTACVLGFVLAASSCNKQLEEYGPSGLTTNSVYSTPTGFETGVNAAYTYMRWVWGKEEGYQIYEDGTDIWTAGVDDQNLDLSTYNNLNPTQKYLAALWPKFYQGLNLCNDLIDRGATTAELTSYSKINTRLAELRYLRAFYLYFIEETWGGVHFSIEPTREDNIATTANRTASEVFLNQMIEDLKFAAANLPNTTSSTYEYGRATKPAAEALLARVYLTANKNQEAFDAANDVIANKGTYGLDLLPKYSDLWSMSNQVNKEVIWAIGYSSNLVYNDFVDNTTNPEGHTRGSNNGHLLFLHKYDQVPGMNRDVANGRPFSRYMPTKFLLDLFDETKDSRYLGSFKDTWICNKPSNFTYTRKLTTGVDKSFTLAPGDTAIYIPKTAMAAAVKDSKKYTTFDINDVYNADGSVKQRKNYVSLNKFADPTRSNAAEQQSARDAFVFRLADVYLMAAEAKLKLGLPADAASLINVVRRRAVLPTLPVTSLDISSAQVTLDFILDERARELAGEQWRWFDLKRTGKLVERVAAYNFDAKPYIKSYHTLRPIPQNQLDAIQNKSEFTQNPGY